MKSIEEIKEELAKEWKFKSWTKMMDIEKGLIDDFEINEVAKRYTQQYANEVENLNDILNIRQSRIIVLEQSNKELVEMLERIVDAQFNPNKSLASLNMAIADAKELIAKHTTHDKGKEESRGD